MGSCRTSGAPDAETLPTAPPSAAVAIAAPSAVGSSESSVAPVSRTRESGPLTSARSSSGSMTRRLRPKGWPSSAYFERRLDGWRLDGFASPRRKSERSRRIFATRSFRRSGIRYGCRRWGIGAIIPHEGSASRRSNWEPNGARQSRG